MAAVFFAGLAFFGVIVVSLVASLALRTAAARSARPETPGFWLTLTAPVGVLPRGIPIPAVHPRWPDRTGLFMHVPLRQRPEQQMSPN